MKRNQQRSIRFIVMWAAAAAPLLLGAFFLYFLLPQPELQKKHPLTQSETPPAHPSHIKEKEKANEVISRIKRMQHSASSSAEQYQKNIIASNYVPQKTIDSAPRTNFSGQKDTLTQSNTTHPRIAIIIDDIGHQWPSSKQSAELIGAYTLAILPGSPFAEKAANLGVEFGKEIMLHAPMEPIKHKSWNGGLEQSMNENEIKTALSEMLDKVPLAIGINNHMGSAFTQNLRAMNWVMEAIGPRGLYFVDSRTSPLSEGLNAAQTNDVPSIKRDVFLDNIRDENAIKIQLKKLVAKAKTKGTALGIGHPYPETLTVLAAFKEVLSSEGVELVTVSNLLRTKEQLASNHRLPSPESSKKL